MRHAIRDLAHAGLVVAMLYVTGDAYAQDATPAAKISTITVPKSLVTLAKIKPEPEALFGQWVAAVGTNRVLVGTPGDGAGAPESGAAYLFDADGALLTTFTNPAPTFRGHFGWSGAAVGTDRVLIGAVRNDAGAEDAGEAFLFGTDGTLLTTFTNPVPAIEDYFGFSVAALGTDRVVIGASSSNIGATDAGVVYLLSAKGALLTTFTNPSPASLEYFGYSVAGVGTDRVLIGAIYDGGGWWAGAAYLYDTNGALITTFTNPRGGFDDRFSGSLAAVGADRVLIGASHAGVGALGAGVAYLFSTNGTLLTTFTNPTPAESEYFGLSVAAVGTDRVLIGAYWEETGAFDAGAAYLFNTNGVLLDTFIIPTPGFAINWATSVAAVGSDRIVIGAPYSNSGALDAGAAYLFKPPFQITTVSWPVAAGNWTLERTNALPLVSAAPWPQVPPPYQTNGEMISVTFTNNAATGNAFFRLHQP